MTRLGILLVGAMVFSSCDLSRSPGTQNPGQSLESARATAAQPVIASDSALTHTHYAFVSASPSSATAHDVLSSTAVETALPLSSAAPSVTLSGSGEDQTDLFSLAPGLAVFHFEHPAATPFAAFLLNERGDHLGLLANGTALDSRQVFGITTPGRYTLHMIAQDDWQARVEQPSPEELQREATAREVLEGQGSTATAPILLNQGAQRVEWTHNGTFPVTLLLWSLDGQQRVEIVVNSTAASGAATITLPATTPFVLDVQANGAWTASFPRP